MQKTEPVSSTLLMEVFGDETSWSITASGFMTGVVELKLSLLAIKYCNRFVATLLNYDSVTWGIFL